MSPNGHHDASARSFAQILVDSARTWGDNEALVTPTTRWTYNELVTEARRFALALRALDVQPGDVVAPLLPNSADMVAAMFGISWAGAIFVPLNTRFRQTELSHVLRDANPAVVITSDQIDDYTNLGDRLTECLPGLAEAPDRRALAIDGSPDLKTVVHLSDDGRPGMLSSAEFYAGIDDDLQEPATPPEYSAIVYTSGTTSMPRGALLTPAAFEHWAFCGSLWKITETDRFWDPCPLFHIAGIGPIVWTYNVGATFITDTYFDAGRALKQIEQERATLLYPTYPPIMTDLILHESFKTTDLSCARAMLNVAPPEDLRNFQEALPHVAQISLYGSTEGGPVTMHHVDDDLETLIRTNGMPVEGVEVGVFDPESGERLTDGATGEIRYRGRNTLSGYLNDPVKSAATIDDEGWVHTGDSGFLGERGELYFRGRSNDMLKVGGENVAPSEVEGILSSHPEVKLSQAFGVPDKRLVEVVAAYVELVAGSTLTEEDILHYCKANMARYKVPAYLRIVTSWPMSATKIQRGKLRDELIAEERLK